MSQSFDWPVLLKAGVQGLGLAPRDFWALTPAELALMLGAEARPAMGRARLEALLAKWPDRKAGALGPEKRGEDGGAG